MIGIDKHMTLSYNGLFVIYSSSNTYKATDLRSKGEELKHVSDDLWKLHWSFCGYLYLSLSVWKAQLEILRTDLSAKFLLYFSSGQTAGMVGKYYLY